MTLVVHADWSKHAFKRWMTVIRPEDGQWRVAPPEPVGNTATLLDRLRARAGDAAVAFGIDCPLGLPRAYAALHARAADYPEFLRGLDARSGFTDVARTLDEVSAARPFYPARGTAGMTRLSHALALGMADARGLCRACDMATVERPAGAPLFWTLGANQSGKAAIAAWQELIGPALRGAAPPRLWPFEGRLHALLRPGAVVIAETYPAEAMRHLDVARVGSKRRRADRVVCAPALRAAIARLGGVADAAAAQAITDGFGNDAAGEDRMDCLLGALCVLGVVSGARADWVPEDPWVTTWEGWVLGQNVTPKKEV